MLVTLGAVGVALSVLPAPNVSASELSGCPLDGDLGLPVYFLYEPKGRTRSAEAGIVLPAGFESLRRLVDDVEGYPEWALLDRDGSPLLGEMSFDPVTGLGTIVFGKSGETRIEGMVTREAGPSYYHIRLEMLAGHAIKKAVIEVSVSPDPACPMASFVETRATWKVGLLAHLFADEITLSMPAFLLLAIRDDLAARVLAERYDIREVLMEVAPSIASGATGGDDAVEAGDVSLIHFEPAVARVGVGGARKLRGIVGAWEEGKAVKPAAAMRALVDAMSSASRIVGYHAVFSIEGIETTAHVSQPASPGDLHYWLELSEESFGFSCRFEPQPGDVPQHPQARQ